MENGQVVFQAPFFEESETILETDIIQKPKVKYKKIDEKSNLYFALLFSLKTYMKNNNFQKIILGLSGGIDSALCLMLAVDAIKSKKCPLLLFSYNI